MRAIARSGDGHGCGPARRRADGRDLCGAARREARLSRQRRERRAGDLRACADRHERLRSLVVAASTGSFSEKEIKDFSKRIEIPNVPWPSAWLEVGFSYIGGNPEGLEKWKAIEEHARQPGSPSQGLRTPNTFAKVEA